MSARNPPMTAEDGVPDGTDTDVGTEQTTAAESATEESVDELPLDQVFEILKNKRRRTVLRYLKSHEGSVALGDLAEEVAAVENHTPVAQVTSRERKYAYVGLYQCHLPKMDDMNIVEFNQNRGRIETGPNAERIEQYLDWGETDERPWRLYYGAASGAGIVLVGVAALAAGPGLAVAASLVSLLAVAGVAGAHAFQDDDTDEPVLPTGR